MARVAPGDLAGRLGRQAEAVCRHYLTAGNRQGHYWLVGDVRNTAGRSMFVRLTGPQSGKRAAGKWTDAATGEHGDLLDVIREALGLVDFKDVAAEAHRFLNLPHPQPSNGGDERRGHHKPAALPGSGEAARRLFAMSQPIRGTVVESYLGNRGILSLHGTESLRFHPRCYYRRDEDSPTETWPAMIAAVTDPSDKLTGAHRTWLDPSGTGKAPIDTPRRAMGDLLGHAVRFGVAGDVMAAGEGIETMLSLRCILPSLPTAAALSAAHLSAMQFPAKLRRLYIARDDDPAGDRARDRLTYRAQAVGIDAITLSPWLGDFNQDLRTLGIGALRRAIRVQLAPEDVHRFMGVKAG